MTQRIALEGRVVEARGAKVVRFAAQPAACPAADAGGCACGRGRKPDLALTHLATSAAVGEAVEVSVAARGLTVVALALFGAPLVMLVLGAVAGGAFSQWLGWPVDSGAGFGGLIALAGAWWLAARSGRTLLGMLRLDVRTQ